MRMGEESKRARRRMKIRILKEMNERCEERKRTRERGRIRIIKEINQKVGSE